MNCTVRFGKQFSESSPCLPWQQGTGQQGKYTSGTLRNSLHILLYEVFCHLVELLRTGITPDIIGHQLFLLLQLLRDLGRLRYLRQLPQVPRRRREPRHPRAGGCGRRVRLRDVAGRRPVGRRETTGSDGQNRPAGVADPGGGHRGGVLVPVVHAVVGHHRRRCRDVPRVVVLGRNSIHLQMSRKSSQKSSGYSFEDEFNELFQ